LSLILVSITSWTIGHWSAPKSYQFMETNWLVQLGTFCFCLARLRPTLQILK